MTHYRTLFFLGTILMVAGCEHGTKITKADTTPPQNPAKLQIVQESETLEKQAKSLVERWRESQTKHDSTTYKSFYSKKGFKGVKRKSDGEVTKYTYTSWLTDRLKTLPKIEGLAVEGVSVKTWGQDSNLGKGIVKVRFLQRWRSAQYSDHGEKILLLHYRFGKLRIVYEDLLNAEPGWGKGTVVTNGQKISIENKKQAILFWKDAKISGANVDTFLSEIACEEDGCALLAAVVFDLGKLNCSEVVASEEECGQMTGEARAPLQSRADLNNACLRRRVAAWAVENLSGKEFDLRRTLWKTLAGDGYYDPLHEAIYSRVFDTNTKLSQSDLDILKHAVDAKHFSDDAYMIDGIQDSKKVELFELGHQRSGFLLEDRKLKDAAHDILLRGKGNIEEWGALFTRFSSLFSVQELERLLVREPEMQALVIGELLKKGVDALPPSSTISEAQQNFEVLYFLNRVGHLVEKFSLKESRMVEEQTNTGWKTRKLVDTTIERELPNLSNPDIEGWQIVFRKTGSRILVERLDIELIPAYGCGC